MKKLCLEYMILQMYKNCLEKDPESIPGPGAALIDIGVGWGGGGVTQPAGNCGVALNISHNLLKICFVVCLKNRCLGNS